MTATLDKITRLDDQVRLSDRLMAPVVLLPTVNVPAVRPFNSPWERPRLFEVSVPFPRLMPEPNVRIVTFPVVVALTDPVPAMFNRLAVMVIELAVVVHADV